MKLLPFIAKTFSLFYRLQALRVARRAFRKVPKFSTSLFGYKLIINTERSDMHKLLALKGESFIEERCLFEGCISKGGTVIDVGANIGYYALLFSKLTGHSGSVIALEPEPSNYSELVATLSANGLKSVTTLQKAAGRDRGTLDLSLGVNGKIGANGGPHTPVEVITLDEIAPPRVNFIKIDVEGFEGDVLLGMKEVLSREDKPTLFMEIHPWCLSSDISVAFIINELRRSYSSRRYFKRRNESSIVSKILTAYGLRPPFLELKEEEAILLEGDNKVFWTLCKAG